MSTPKISGDILARTMEVYEECGRNQMDAATRLGIARSTLQNRLRIAEARRDNPEKALGVLAPVDARDGLGMYAIKGVSTNLDGEGNVTQQWVRTKLDDAKRLAALEKAIAARVERIEPLPPIPYTRHSFEPNPDTKLNLLTVTDAHIGMLAWDKEAGEDWDLNIARDTLLRTFVGMLRNAPPAGVCVVNLQGDFFHFDGLKPVTPAHGNILDADSRYQKMLGVGSDIAEEIIVEAARLFPQVHVVVEEGNHDESTTCALRIYLNRVFRDNPRVDVDISPLPYHAYLHGKTLLGFHHGHLAKITSLPAIFAGDPRFRPLWGQATMAYIHCGHYHQHEVVPFPGGETERHPTIAARDAFAARGGYVSDRRAFLITYDKENGEVGRIAATPETYA